MESQPRFDLSGQNALVTGATRGIGLAIARGLGEHGARVVITGRKPENLEKAEEELQKEGIDALGILCHQGERRAIMELFERLDEQERAPSILVVNAATNPIYGPLIEVEMEAWHKMIDVNLTGSLLTAQQAARRMKMARSGSILFVSSVAGLEPIAGLGAYSITKAGMLGMMRAMAQELGSEGVRVNAIAPGLVETRFSSALFENKRAYEALVGQLPIRRHGHPEDMTGVAIFLSSPAAAYITGQTFVVDGGGRM